MTDRLDAEPVDQCNYGSHVGSKEVYDLFFFFFMSYN